MKRPFRTLLCLAAQPWVDSVVRAATAAARTTWVGDSTRPASAQAPYTGAAVAAAPPHTPSCANSHAPASFNSRLLRAKTADCCGQLGSLTRPPPWSRSTIGATTPALST